MKVAWSKIVVMMLVRNDSTVDVCLRILFVNRFM